MATASTPVSEEKRVKRQIYYQANVIEERNKARLRNRKRLAKESPEEAVARRERHRQAQARYREMNRLQLKTKSWQDRLTKKREKSLQDDEEEFQRLWNQE